MIAEFNLSAIIFISFSRGQKFSQWASR